MVMTSKLKPFQVAILFLLILVGLLVPSGKSIVALALLPLALMDRNKAIFVLIALFLVRMSNPAISGSDPLISTTAWMTSFAASTRLWIDFSVRREYRFSRQMVMLFIFILVAFIVSIFGMSPTISTLKIVAFYYIAGAAFVGITSPIPSKSTALSWLYAAWVSVMISSILILPFPQLGYFRDGQGFQGSLNHPQLLGIFMAPMVAWLLSDLLRKRRLSFSSVAMLVVVISLLFLTKARTGIVSIIMAVLILCIYRIGDIKFFLKNFIRKKKFLLFLFLIILTSPILHNQFRADIEDFIFKSAASNELSSVFEESRGFIIKQALINIKSNPIAGIGFGVSKSESHAFNVEIDSISGLPIGAPTEKANLIIAVLEETGVIGLIAFAAFFLPFMRIIGSSGNISLALAAFTSICTNISEMTFFSMGGSGVYTWIICAIAIAQVPLQHRHAQTLKLIPSLKFRTQPPK